MRTTIIILTAVCTIASIALIAHSTYKQPTTTDISVLQDITENDSVLQVGLNDIAPLYGNDIWNGREFQFLNLSDVSYGKERGANLPPANKWLSNELERKQQVLYFQKNLTQIFADATIVQQGKKQSSLYLPIANELKTLTENKAQRKLLIIASDLIENTTALSFYNPATMKLLQAHPDEIEKSLGQRQSLPDLHGIEIYLLYYPKTPAEDNKYQIVSSFYKTLFEKKGATVTIGSLPHLQNQ